MAAIKNLQTLLASMEPILDSEEYVFCTFPETTVADLLYLEPIGSFWEKEGLTLIVNKAIAGKHNIQFDSTFALISLTIHSSLEAVGLTAAIANKLTSKNISTNVVAAYYHDHLFVPKDKAQEAMNALYELQTESRD